MVQFSDLKLHTDVLSHCWCSLFWLEEVTKLSSLLYRGFFRIFLRVLLVLCCFAYGTFNDHVSCLCCFTNIFDVCLRHRRFNNHLLLTSWCLLHLGFRRFYGPISTETNIRLLIINWRATASPRWSR